MKDYDIGSAFETVEHELINSMLRNMKRHKAWENDEGFNWAMWQAEQLKGLEQYRVQNHKKFSKQFNGINRSVVEIIRQAHEAGALDQEIDIFEAIQNGFKGYKRAGKPIQAEFFRLNDRKLNALVKATTKDMEKAETALLRMANDKYRRIIYNAQVYANTGAGTYEKAVDMATKEFLSNSLNCIEYANGARHTLSDYADMAIRTAAKRAYLAGEGMKRQEWGISTVIVNKRGNPCPKCLPFCGKVLIDDVWSGGKADGKHQLMSAAISAGLYHPRCKDSHTTYFVGVSTPPESIYTKKEMKEIQAAYEIEQKKQYAARQAEKFGRLADGSLDPENKGKYAGKQKLWRGLAAGGSGVITPMEPPKFVEKIDMSNPALLESKLKEYEVLIRDAAEEHAYVILENGKVYHFVGEKNGVNPGLLGGALKGATLTHNHPVGSNNEYSFSSEDFALFDECGLKVMRGTDERFTYVLDRLSVHRDKSIIPINMDPDTDYAHNKAIEAAELQNIGYWRVENVK